MLDNICVIMSHTFDSGNIGSAARAMKTMGLQHLILINPKDFPSEKALSLAAGAIDILDNARIVNSVEEAIADCQIVIGTSARSRTNQRENLSSRQCAEQFSPLSKHNKIGLLFGRERDGLNKHELNQCQYYVHIPANEDYPVLNVSAAIQILCYEFRQTVIGSSHLTSAALNTNEDYPSQQEMAFFYDKLTHLLRTTGYIDERNQDITLSNYRKLYSQNPPNKQQLGLLIGMLTSIEHKFIDK